TIGDWPSSVNVTPAALTEGACGPTGSATTCVATRMAVTTSFSQYRCMVGALGRRPPSRELIDADPRCLDTHWRTLSAYARPPVSRPTNGDSRLSIQRSPGPEYAATQNIARIPSRQPIFLPSAYVRPS